MLGDRLELLQTLLGFRIFGLISDFLKYGQDFLDREVFQFIPDIRTLKISLLTEEAFHDLIGLTAEEKRAVQRT